MRKKNVVFLGAKKIGYLCFEELLAHHQKSDCVISGVITRDTNLDAGDTITSLCEQNNIPLLDNLSDLMSLDDLDILISVQHDQILKKEHINQAAEIAVNLHLAPLPEYRGCNQFSFAIIDQARWFGATIHKIDEGIDSGDILFETRFEIDSDSLWVEQLYERTVQAGRELFADHISDILEANYSATPQEDYLLSRGTSIHYRSEINKIKQIQLSWNDEKIGRHIRATSMPGFEPPHVLVDNKKVFLTRNYE